MKINVLTKSKFFFASMYFPYVLIEALSQTGYYRPEMAYIQLFCLICIPIKFLFDKKLSMKNMPIWICLLLVCLIVSYNTDAYAKILALFLFVFFANNIDAKLIIRLSFIALAVVLIFTVLGSFFGILPWEYIIQRQGERIRYNLGFSYTTYAANFYMHCIIMWLFLKNRCPKVFEALIIFAINYVLYIYTDTKVPFWEINLLLIFSFCMKKIDIANSKWIKRFFGTAFIWSMLIAFFAQINYSPSNPIMLKLNELTSSRLELGNIAFRQYGLSILGQGIIWNSFNYVNGAMGYFYVDSSYLNIGIQYGLVILLVLVVGFSYLMLESIQNNNIFYCIALLFVAIHAITDPQLFSLLYNPFLFLLGHRISVSGTQNDKNVNELFSGKIKRRIHFKM